MRVILYSVIVWAIGSVPLALLVGRMCRAREFSAAYDPTRELNSRSTLPS